MKVVKVSEIIRILKKDGWYLAHQKGKKRRLVSGTPERQPPPVQASLEKGKGDGQREIVGRPVG